MAVEDKCITFQYISILLHLFTGVKYGDSVVYLSVNILSTYLENLNSTLVGLRSETYTGMRNRNELKSYLIIKLVVHWVSDMAKS